MQIKLDEKNARVHSQENLMAIRESLAYSGAGRSILIDADNKIVGGEGVFRNAEALGIPVRIVETDGSELIAVKRTDLNTEDPRRKALAIADNRCSDLSEFDDEKLADLIAEINIPEVIRAAGFQPEEVAEILNPAPEKERPEVEFSEELLECHNYVVLYFDNDVDWLQAETLFDLKTVKDSKLYGKTERRGIGRVLRGADAINRILRSK